MLRSFLPNPFDYIASSESMMKFPNPPTGTGMLKTLNYKEEPVGRGVEPLDTPLTTVNDENRQKCYCFTSGQLLQKHFVVHVRPADAEPALNNSVIVRDLRFKNAAIPYKWTGEGVLKKYAAFDLRSGLAVVEDRVHRVSLNADTRCIEPTGDSWSFGSDQVVNIEILNDSLVFVHTYARGLQWLTIHSWADLTHAFCREEIDENVVSAAQLTSAAIARGRCCVLAAYMANYDGQMIPRTVQWDFADPRNVKVSRVSMELMNYRGFDLISPNPQLQFSLNWANDELFYVLNRFTPKEIADTYILPIRTYVWAKIGLPDEMHTSGDQLALVRDPRNNRGGRLVFRRHHQAVPNSDKRCSTTMYTLDVSKDGAEREDDEDDEKLRDHSGWELLEKFCDLSTKFHFAQLDSAASEGNDKLLGCFRSEAIAVWRQLNADEANDDLIQDVQPLLFAVDDSDEQTGEEEKATTATEATIEEEPKKIEAKRSGGPPKNKPESQMIDQSVEFIDVESPVRRRVPNKPESQVVDIEEEVLVEQADSNDLKAESEGSNGDTPAAAPHKAVIPDEAFGFDAAEKKD